MHNVQIYCLIILKFQFQFETEFENNMSLKVYSLHGFLLTKNFLITVYLKFFAANLLVKVNNVKYSKKLRSV